MGRDFALQLDKAIHPDEIWLVARRRDRLEELVTQLRPGVGKVHELDLGSAAGCDTLIAALEDTVKAGNQLVALVNNAGFGSYGPFADNDRNWQLSMIDLNVRALTSLSWIAVKHLGPGGLLINVASLAAFMPLGNFAVYAATKSYVLSFTTALAAEVKDQGIMVLALCPGPVETEFAKVASNGARLDVLHGKTSPAVVAHCIKKALNGSYLAVHGFDWKFQAFLARILGRFTVARFALKFMKRPQAKRGE